MEAAKPSATNYLRKWHTRLWTRSQFSTISKVDYVTNNLAESFNNWIKHHKSLNLDDLMDKLRQMLMIKWNQRRKIAMKLDGWILPHIIKKLKEMSRELNLEVLECSEVAEVTALGVLALGLLSTCKIRHVHVDSGKFLAFLANMQ